MRRGNSQQQQPPAPTRHVQPHMLAANQVADQSTRSLFDAVSADNVDLTQTLLQNGANPNWYNHKEGGATTLIVAAERGNEAIVRLLLTYGASIEVIHLPLKIHHSIWVRFYIVL